MHHSDMLYEVLIFLVAAVIIVPIFRRFKTSPILGYLAAGILVGPHGLALINDSESAATLAEFGVVFLLFMIGLELSVERLRALGRFVFGLGSAQVIVTGILIGLIAYSLGLPTEGAIIVGAGLALSSTAFVMQLLVERGERASPHGNISFAVLLFQDLAIVPLLILTTILGQGEGSFLSALGLAAAKAVGVLIFVIVAGRVILRPIYRMVAETRSSELFIATTLLVVLGTGWLMSLVGISMVLGAFLAGLLLSETEYKHQVGTDIRPFRGILLGLFFMTVGMSINLQLIQTEWLQVSFIVVALLLLKSAVTAILCRLFGIKTDTSVRAGLFLSQGGEFGFILFMTAAGLGLLSNEIAQILLAAVTLTMIATPLMALLGTHLSTLLREDDNDPTHNITNADVELHDHVVIAGFGRVGETVATVLSAANVPYVALEMDARRVAACRAKGLPVYFGDASQIEVLNSAGASLARGMVVTIDQHAQADLIVTNLRGFFPGLPIIVRAKDLPHVRHLENRGATQAVPEALEASLQLGANAMTAIGVRADEIMEVIQEMRDDDYAILNQATENWERNKVEHMPL